MVQDSNETVANRAGLVWDYSDYERLVESVRQGLDDEDVSRAVGRTLNGLLSRVAKFVLPEPPARRSDALDELRALLILDSGYEWESAVAASHAREDIPLWRPDDDDQLRIAWKHGSPALPELSRSLAVREGDTADRMIRLGLGETRLSIVERLGCTPGSTLDVNARLARDKSSIAVWALVITGENGVVHVSLHANHDGAASTRDLLASLSGEESGWLGQHDWVIAQRVVGEGSVRQEHRGSLHPRG